MIVGIAFAVLVLLIGFTSNPSHMVRHGRESINTVREFDALFPNATHFISYWTGTHGDPMWNSEIGLHGRYILAMQADIDLNLIRSRVSNFGPPKFYLSEVESVEHMVDGRSAIKQREVAGHLCDGADWEKLVNAHGDFHVLGIDLKIDQPVPGFERAIHAR